MSTATLLVEQAAKIVAAGIEIGPRWEPCVCGAGKHAHSGVSGTGKSESTGCKRYRADRVWSLVWQAIDAGALSLGESMRAFDKADRAKHYKANPRKPGEWSIGASDAGTCRKKIWYRNTPPEDFEPAEEDTREALMGTVIHEEVTRRLRALYPWRLYKFKVTIPGLDRKSELDVYDPVTGVLDDIKTAGDWRWDILGDEGPTWETWEQTLLYGLGMEDVGYPVTTLRLLYIKRCNGHDEVFEMKYDRAKAERARDRLLGIATALDLGQDLPRDGSGPRTDGLCRRCFARNHCWSIPAAEQAGRSPENLTLLGTHPEDEDISFAIATKVEATAVRLAADKTEEAAKALVDGIEPGRYGPDGEWEVYTSSSGGGPNYKASYEQVLTYLDLPDGMRPDPDAVEPIRGRKNAIVKVGKVRKATLAQEAKDRAALAKAEAAGA